MEITITIGELMDKFNWNKACEVLGLDEWCVNEGRANSSDEITLTSEQAQELGLIRKIGLKI